MTRGRVRGRGQVVSGYLLYRGDWISGKGMARGRSVNGTVMI